MRPPWRSRSRSRPRMRCLATPPGPNARRYARTRCARPSASVAVAGPTQSSARARRSARRRSHVPAGGTRTRSTHSPSVPTKPVARSPSSLTVRGPSARAARMRSAAASMSRSPTPLTRMAVLRHCSRRAWRTPSAKGQYSRRETMWIVTRMSVAWMIDRSSNAAVRAAAFEAGEPRPQPDIPGRRVLGLQAADLVHGVRDRQCRTFKQQLSCQERAVQGALRQDLVSHRTMMASRAIGAVVCCEDGDRRPAEHRAHGHLVVDRRRDRPPAGRTGAAPRSPRARPRVGAPSESFLARPDHGRRQRGPGVRHQRRRRSLPRRTHGADLARVPVRRRVPGPARARDTRRPARAAERRVRHRHPGRARARIDIRRCLDQRDRRASRALGAPHPAGAARRSDRPHGGLGDLLPRPAATLGWAASCQGGGRPADDPRGARPSLCMPSLHGARSACISIGAARSCCQWRSR